MKNKLWSEPRLLKVGFILSVTGSLSAIILCICALFNSSFFPGFFVFFSFAILLSGFVLIVIDCQKDSKKQQKIYEDVEALLKRYHEIQKREILHKILITRFLSTLEKLDKEG